MDLLDPPLPDDTKEKLIKLVTIYTQELHFSNERNIPADPKIYTVHNLKVICGGAQNNHVQEMDVADVDQSKVGTPSPPFQSHWKRYEGNAYLF
jgi:hypothetical protein